MSLAIEHALKTCADVGAVCCYRFDAQGNPVALSGDDPVPSGEPGQGFEWLHLNLADGRAQAWLKAAALPQPAKQVMLDADPHHCIHHDDAHVWGIFSDLLSDAEGRAEGQVGHLHFVFGDRLLVTGRRRPLAAVARTRQQLDSGGMAPAPLALFETVVAHVVGEIDDVIGGMIRDLDDIEEHTLGDRVVRDERRRLTPLRRASVRINRQLSGLASIFRRFDHLPDSRLPADFKSVATRLVQRIDFLHHEVEAIQQRARLLGDEIGQKQTAQTNRHLYVLSVLTTLLLPPTLVTGFFGMNTKGLPFGESEWGTLGALTICALAAGAAYLLMRRRGMLG